MANDTTPCPDKAKIDAQAQQAIDAIDPVLAATTPSTADLKKALDLARSTLSAIRSDPHHL